MAHVDPDDLALAALGEELTEEAAAHVAACPDCAAEVASLRRVVLIGRSGTAADAPAPPSSSVWARVRAELDLSADLGTDDLGAADLGADDPAPVADLAAVRRRRSSWWVAAAAAAGLVVGGVGGAWWATRPDTPPSPVTVVAEALLEPLPGWQARGTAVVTETEDGARVVVVDLDDDEPVEGYREVWLIAPDLSGMVSLGPLEGTEGTFTVPAGLELDRFPVVDVSAEPFDGDVTHSGDSIVRGTLA